MARIKDPSEILVAPLKERSNLFSQGGRLYQRLSQSLFFFQLPFCLRRTTTLLL